MLKKFKRLVLSGSLLCALLIWGSSVLIKGSTRSSLYSDLDSVPHRKVGLVLGCSKQLADGRTNLFFQKRIRAAAALYQKGKVDFLLVSGDNGHREYDEPSDMKAALVARGVPAEKIYCDYAGFRTLDSVVRAKEVFGQDAFTVVSQPFHNQRAVFVARELGIEAVGYNAGDVDAFNGFRTQCREKLARVKTVLDLYVLKTQPKFLGEPVLIGARS